MGTYNWKEERGQKKRKETLRNKKVTITKKNKR